MMKLELRGTDDDGYLAWVGGIGAEHSRVVEQFNTMIDLLREAAPCYYRGCPHIAVWETDWAGEYYLYCEQHKSLGNQEVIYPFELGRKINALLER